MPSDSLLVFYGKHMVNTHTHLNDHVTSFGKVLLVLSYCRLSPAQYQMRHQLYTGPEISRPAIHIIFEFGTYLQIITIKEFKMKDIITKQETNDWAELCNVIT